MKKCFIWMGAMAFIASVSMVSAADITGKITLKGTPPAEKLLPLDPNCGKLHTGEKPKTRFYVAAPDGGLAETVIYLKDAGTGKTFPVPSEQALLDQVGCEYAPYVIAIRAGQKLAVRNSDPLLHNVHPTPAVAGNKEVNKAQTAKAPDLIFTFEKPEPFLRFKCDVHPWMFAYVSVFDHPYFAVSGKDGTYTIKNVPAGKYTVESHHRKAGKKSQEVTVAADNVKADFTLEVAAQ